MRGSPMFPPDAQAPGGMEYVDRNRRALIPLLGLREDLALGPIDADNLVPDVPDGFDIVWDLPLGV